MFTSFSTALSALAANSVGIDVVGHNLANLNTTGFKNSVVSFHDLMARTLGIGSGDNQVGMGTGKPLTIRQFSQGAIQLTGSAMDAAIEGDGFFLVKGSNNQTLYTRAGNFRIDASGNLVSGTGQQVQGWTAVNGVLSSAGAPGSIAVQFGAIRPPKASTQMTLDLNLDASASDGATFASPIEVIDALGAKHVLTVMFTKTAANEWDYEVTIPGNEVTAGTAGTPFPIPGATGTLTFDDQGRLTSPAAASGIIDLDIAGLSNGAADLNIEWNLYDANDNSRLMQFAQASAASANSQNGALAGQVSKVSLADGGRIIARYSNGDEQLIAQLALATIQNPDSLVSVGDNNLQLSAGTAAPVIGLPGSGGRGRIAGGALESSTVDIAREFTNLIVLQRSYQANARVVTTTDELSQETINLKR